MKRAIQMPEESTLENLISQGGRAHRVRSKQGRAVDSMLAVYKDRLTFTFVLENEVASIHFDRVKKEIFFRGHNIMNIELTENHVKTLWRLRDVLAEDPEGYGFLQDYHTTLVKVIADNKG